MVRRLATVAALALLAAAPQARAAGWWNLAWGYRRPVAVEDCEPTTWPGDDVAVVTMLTGGKAAADGSDVRVVTARGVERPCRVLMVGPGDRVRVAFAMQKGVRQYYVYFGCAEPPTERPELDVRRGVLLETWRYPGGGAATLDEARDVIDRRAKQRLGADFVDRIFLGHTMFGVDPSVARKFTAHVNCPRDGEYLFALSSRNASFLLVDGQLVVDHGGRHGPHRRPRNAESVTLSRGLHRVVVYHISDRGDPVIAAAWRPPGQKRRTIIPPGAFPPVCRAEPGPMRKQGSAAGVDFRCEHAGEAFLEGRYYQRYVFTALPTGRVPRDVTWKWTFGDGQTAEGTKVEHVYVTDGLRTVTVRARTGIGVLERTNRIAVSRPWKRQAVRDIDRPRAYADIVAGYDFTQLSDVGAAAAVVLLHRTGKDAAALDASAAVVAGDRIADEAARQVLPLYAKLLRQTDRTDHAVEMLREAASKVHSPAVAADLLVRAGRLALDELRDPDRAESLFRSAVEDYAHLTTADPIRAAKIGLGDVHRARGDGDKAAEAYRKAGRGDLRRKAPAVARGSFARQAEAWTRQGEFDAAAETLDQWGRLLPADRLQGNLTRLRVRLLMAQKRYDEAAWRAETLVSANPDSPHAPRLLLLAAQAHAGLGRGEQARAALKRLVEGYPESPLAAQAAERIEKD